MVDLKEFFKNYAREHKTTIFGMEKDAGLAVSTIAKASSRMYLDNFVRIIKAFPDMDVYTILELPRPETAQTAPVAHENPCGGTLFSSSPDNASEVAFLRQQIDLKDKQIDFLMRQIEKGGQKCITNIQYVIKYGGTQ